MPNTKLFRALPESGNQVYTERTQMHAAVNTFRYILRMYVCTSIHNKRAAKDYHNPPNFQFPPRAPMHQTDNGTTDIGHFLAGGGETEGGPDKVRPRAASQTAIFSAMHC